jgi:dihydrofolate synthase/folylpolyglutamate synthase
VVCLTKVDVAVIEVGLGGRLDSTNIITPELSVITNISYDHINLLGDTLEKIAAEKQVLLKKASLLLSAKPYLKPNVCYRKSDRIKCANIFRK